jgi:hypothetical protein
MYRILHDFSEVRERRNQRQHPPYHKPELLAEGPNSTPGWGSRRAAPEIEALSGAVRRVQVPVGKDVNDFYLLAGPTAIQAWIKANLE